MHRIELIGRREAKSGEIHHRSSEKKSPLGPIARLMIENGATADDLVEVWRGDVLVFHASPLASYADFDVIDTDNHGLVKRKFKAGYWGSDD